jgi:hypothetical protein
MSKEAALLMFLDSNVLVRGFKIQAMTTEKRSGIFTFKGVRWYFYILNNVTTIERF